MQVPIKRGSSELKSGKQVSGQRNTLQMAFVKLQDQQLAIEQVRRVAVDRQGVIHIEVNEAGKHRFFVHKANELRELQPENDPKIPLLAKLHEVGFAADHNIISYRPGRRIVLGPADGEHGNIVKAYKKHHAAQAAERYAIALSACESGGFDVPELLRYETDKDCLVMAKRSGRAPVVAAATVGLWADIGSCLRRFQQFLLTDGLRKFSDRDELDVLDERARRFLLCMPHLPERWQDGRERLEDVAINLPPAVKGLVHRDLHDRQFLVANNTISLLDFDLICIADVAIDAGNLLAHMKLRAQQKKQGNGDPVVTVCSKAFLGGLGRQDEPGFERRLLFYQATAFYRLALLYALRPRWAHLTDSLIREGKRCIDEANTLRSRP